MESRALDSSDPDVSLDSDGPAPHTQLRLNIRPPPRHRLTFFTMDTMNVRHKHNSRTEREKCVVQYSERNLNIMGMQEAHPDVSHGTLLSRS